MGPQGRGGADPFRRARPLLPAADEDALASCGGPGRRAAEDPAAAPRASLLPAGDGDLAGAVLKALPDEDFTRSAKDHPLLEGADPPARTLRNV